MPELDIGKSAQALRQLVATRQRFWITTHESPDGDAIGAALALQRVLEPLGKNVVVVRQEPFPSAYLDLPGADRMVAIADLAALPPPDVVVAVDVGSFTRVGDVRRYVRDDTDVLNIDHHEGSPGETGGRLLNLVDTACASTTMLTYLLVEGAWPGSIDREAANCLYLGLITDTGCFRFSNTNARTLEVGAALARLGADAGTLAERFMFRRRPQALKLLGEVLASIEFHCGGRLAVLRLTRDMLQRTQARVDETEGFVNYATSLEGVQAAALLREQESGGTRASLRASGDLDVARIAREFGGGGHRKAAGLGIDAGVDAARDRIVAAVLRHLDETVFEESS